MNIKKENLVITVEGELGSREEALANQLAEMLGMNCYSSEILTEASHISGISEKLLRRYETHPVRQAYDLLAEDESRLHLPKASDFLSAQLAACRRLAETGAGILVNHHANTALAGLANHFSIFVHASHESRLREMQLSESAFKAQDRAHRRYFRSVSRHWGEADHYDLTVNATDTPVEVLAANIVRYLENLSQEMLAPAAQHQIRRA